MFGDEKTTGKSSMDDLHEGKMTLLVRHALVHAKPDQLKRLHEVYGNKEATQRQHAEVCAILIDTGSRDYVVKEAQKAAQAALGLLSAQVSWNTKGKQCLSDLLSYTISRRSEEHTSELQS